MKLSAVQACSSVNQNSKYRNQSFGNAFVTLSRANLGDVIAKNVSAYNGGDFAKMYKQSIAIAQNVINAVNKRLGISDVRIKNVSDLVENVDLFALAAGSGSRFKVLAQSVANMRANGEAFNKISVPFELGRGQQPLTMLDIPMAMGRFFAQETGYEKIIAEKPTGSFGDVILRYLHTGRKPKDVVVCCGDNVFDMKSADMLDFVVSTINNPQKQLGVVGVARTPEEVAKRFGVLKVGLKDSQSGLYPLEGFVEKPSFDAAQALVTEDGVNVANTGMFVIKKESMEKLLDIIRHEQKVLGGQTTYIAKDPVKEIYDFAAATKWTQAINGSGASDVKIVKTWEDVGEPAAYLRWAQQLRQGHYLDNFTPERRAAILEATQRRVGDNFIDFSVNPKASDVVDGINIKA